LVQILVSRVEEGTIRTLRYAFFWDITHPRVVDPYWRFAAYAYIGPTFNGQDLSFCAA